MKLSFEAHAIWYTEQMTQASGTRDINASPDIHSVSGIAWAPFQSRSNSSSYTSNCAPLPQISTIHLYPDCLTSLIREYPFQGCLRVAKRPSSIILPFYGVAPGNHRDICHIALRPGNTGSSGNQARSCRARSNRIKRQTQVHSFGCPH